MLNIPDSIKTLFKTDGVRKNFRVHFPNGEMSDLTNENVVAESVEFSESLMSQSVFRFGLAEASTLEFETVGVGNMLGYTIEAGIEIDTSSLSAADISAIQADEGDGVLVLSADSDIGYGFYRIPLGTFYVDKCPRDHGAMTHRKVTAYSFDAVDVANNATYENWKLDAWGTYANYTANARLLFASILGGNNPETIESLDFTKTLVADVTGFAQSSSGSTIYVTVGGVQRTLQWTVHDAYVMLNDTNLTDSELPASNTLYSIDPGAHTDALTQLVAWFEANGIDCPSEYKNLEAYIAAECTTALPNLWYRNITPFYGNQRHYVSKEIVVYPYRAYNMNAQYRVPLYIDISFYGGSSTRITPSGISDNPAKLYRFADNNPITQQLVFKSTSVIKTTPSTLYSFTGAYKPVDIVKSYAEANATFVKPTRHGGVNVMRLSNANPVSVIPGNYEECWWDEFDVAPIGTVVVAYLENNKDKNVRAITIGDGQSWYDMTDNVFLACSAQTSLTAVTNMIKTMFAPYLDVVAFTPVDLTMQGWPWIEAGDALQIEAEDGTIVNTYALRIEMKGIQALQSAITAESGEIAGEA